MMENREECRLPMFGRLRVHAVCWMVFLGLAVAMLLSCGTRRSSVQIENSKTKAEEKSTSIGSVKKESGSSDEQVDKESKADVNVNVVTVTKETFDKGEIKERVTTTELSKTDKSSSNERKSLKTAYNRVDSNFNTTFYKMVTITTHKKDKETESSNKQWAWVAWIVLIVAVLAYFAYRWLTKRKI